MNSGFTDKPVDNISEDVFGVEQYISGLSEFILECNTPMTIAIQGDWGSGKTSMMNMIRENLGEKIVDTWFNTWQYSQFNMSDELAVSFLSRLIADLETENTTGNSKVQKTLKILSGFMKTASIIAADRFIGGKAGEAVEKGLGAVEEEETDVPKAICELREQFRTAVENKIKASGKDRLVIFIDDLDRLQPGKAVEMLEVLKLFLDCEKCVFVLAIDYAVVSQGIKQKYGELIGEEKGKSFFDKIIQVPFKMPVAQYNVRNYVETSMKSLGIEVSGYEIESYVKLIRKSVGCNPRAMKRLFNAFLLLTKIAKKNTVDEISRRKMLFAILCLQLSFENIYNFIISNASECFDNNLLTILSSTEAYTDETDGEKLSNTLELRTESEIAKAADFMDTFKSIIDADGDNVLSKEEIRSFNEILMFSTITANNHPVENFENGAENHYRYHNRDIVKDILNKINGKIKEPYRIYQTRTNNNVNWRKYYAGGWKKIPTSFGGVNIEFKIATNLNTRESALSIWVYPADKADRKIFRESFSAWYEKQKHGFVFLEEQYGFWLCNKNIDAEAKTEIVEYFAEIIPPITEEVENCLK